MAKELKVGDCVQVRAYKSKPHKGLSYPAFSGMLLDNAGVSEGWDVVDVIDLRTRTISSIYCFSIERK
jgi:hypothetical protein